MLSSKNIKLRWRCKGLSIGFIAPAGIKMSKNLRTSLIVIGKKDAFVWIMESSFSKYGMIKTRKLLFQKGYEKLKNSLIKHPKVSIFYNQILNPGIRLSRRNITLKMEYPNASDLENASNNPFFTCSEIFERHLINSLSTILR
ncbi:hypothetical protein RhiirC2_370809 [Rhizophagus irregularis]|uniref:Uncharacterized protein n=1 Tax=Rhizophagus irregularis TaxID=588596 RepID=A0A2N1M7R7_9GLOM|nr:hypothetical protein RhiirC2_370809 [Rhizophagus irregularis]